MIVDLPKDSYNIMGLLIDFVYHGSCEVKNLDDIFPILEVFDRYQINKVPFYHMCSDVILVQMESTNYVTLLEKFAKVMSEEGIKKAANKVMVYTNNDFTKFDTTKDLPEEVMLQLLHMDITNHEVDIFDFLVRWHDYQTKDLGRSLQLTQRLFQNVKYSLIIPQILTSKVLPRSDLVNKQLLIDAYYYIYNSCKPLGEYDSKECTLEPAGPTVRKPRCSLEIQWSAYEGKMQRDKLDEYRVSYNSNVDFNTRIMTSSPLRNGIYTFSVLNIAVTQNLNSGVISIAISSQCNEFLYFHPLISDSLITVYVHNEYLFLKLIEGDKVKSTTSILATDLLSICICNNVDVENYLYIDCSFSIHNHMQ